MSVYISMLRGINVGGQKRLSMKALGELYSGMGYSEVQTYVQSGNVVFQSPSNEPHELSSQIEQRIQETFGYTVAVFIRRPEDFQLLLTSNPFLKVRSEDPTKLHVTFLFSNPEEAAWKKAIPPAGIADEFARSEMAVYLFCPNGYGKTKLSNDFFERKLGVMATTRNWNTVNALYTMAQG